MRKIVRLALWVPVMLAPMMGMSQEEIGQTSIFKPFKVDVGINLTFPASNNLTVGGGFFVEPRYSLTDHIQMGLHLGSNIIGEGKYLFQNTEATTKAKAIGNVSLTGEYQFGLDNVRPFVGITAGMYRQSDFEVVDRNNGKIITNQETEVNFGMAPRVGIVAGKFRMSATYHFPGKGITQFVSLGLGMQFGGGKIRRNSE